MFLLYSNFWQQQEPSAGVVAVVGVGWWGGWCSRIQVCSIAADWKLESPELCVVRDASRYPGVERLPSAEAVLHPPPNTHTNPPPPPPSCQIHFGKGPVLLTSG